MAVILVASTAMTTIIVFVIIITAMTLIIIARTQFLNIMTIQTSTQRQYSTPLNRYENTVPNDPNVFENITCNVYPDGSRNGQNASDSQELSLDYLE